ncbi:MAG TPA: GntR family transcriptional regulator, partial [Erysipelotrichaceae bacterium]|nr:GntR family transcriptional regulator [Erysipelotrichaceae bacterium]
MEIRNMKVPKYQIIENDLIDKINHSVYQHGDAIPSEAELCKQYGCSRVTVRQALGNLAYKGFIKRVQGSGAFVERVKVIQRDPFIISFTDDMTAKGKKVKSEVNSFSIINPGETVSKLLNIKETDPIYFIERTRYADDDAIMFERTFMSVELHPNISVNVLKHSKYQYAEDEGLNIE